MKKLLFCIPTLKKGGAERVICNIANYFASMKQYSVFIMLINKTNIEYDLNKSIKVFYANQYNSKIKIINSYRRYFGFRKNVYTINPNIIISFLPSANFLSLLNKHNSKVIISVRNDPKIEYNSLKKKILKRLLYNKANAIVFQTQDAMNYFNFIKTKKVIIPNSVNPKFFLKKNPIKRDKRIVSVGRLEKQKNHKNLILAFNEFYKTCKDYSLHIYGDGSLKSELNTLIKSLKLTGKVFLEGKVDNIENKIYNASLFILSSDYEGMPNVLLEAMALGLPSISTDCPCGGSKMIIDNNINGLLVPVNDYKSLSNAMNEILKNDKILKNYSEKAALIKEKYNPDKINSIWLELIEKGI